MKDDNMIDIRLKEQVVKYSKFSIKAEHINPESNMISDFGMDSMSLICLLNGIEEEFGLIFDIEDLDIDLISKFSSLLELINTKMG